MGEAMVADCSDHDTYMQFRFPLHSLSALRSICLSVCRRFDFLLVEGWYERTRRRRQSASNPVLSNSNVRTSAVTLRVR